MAWIVSNTLLSDCWGKEFPLLSFSFSSAFIRCCAWLPERIEPGLGLAAGVGATPKPVLYGYDVVAYFSLDANDPGVLGSSLYQANLTVGDLSNSSKKMDTTEYTFFFANEKNKNAFEKEPWKFLGPPGGGNDSWAVYSGNATGNKPALILNFFPEIRKLTSGMLMLVGENFMEI
eukprot:jgi/Bigna1/92036/estExt_fgenesh1_pg.C_1980001